MRLRKAKDVVHSVDPHLNREFTEVVAQRDFVVGNVSTPLGNKRTRHARMISSVTVLNWGGMRNGGGLGVKGGKLGLLREEHDPIIAQKYEQERLFVWH